VTFTKHNEGPNWRRTYFNRECWLLLVGPPLDHWFTEDINAAFSDIGKVLLWEKDLGNKGRILVKVRVTELVEIPKSIRFSEGDAAESESWTFSVEILQESLLGGGPADEDPLPGDGEDPHPLPNLQPLNPQLPQNPLPAVAEQDDLDDVGGWDHWAMGNDAANVAQPMDLDANQNLALNNLLDAVEAEELQMNHLYPAQLLSSDITVSSSEGANSVNNPAAQGSDSAQMEVQQPAGNIGLGAGLQNLIEAYHDDEGDSGSENSMGNMFMLDDINMMNPNEAHLQIGFVRTHFYPVENSVSHCFSQEGMEIWEKYFAPHISSTEESKGNLFHIPVSWFNFITLMLMTPEKFDWAVNFLNSPLWECIKEPIENESIISFFVPDKCVTQLAPSCKLSEISEEEMCMETPAAPMRKRKSKVPLVETEVRRSPRIVELNGGFKSHTNCQDNNCLTCNAAPPQLQNRIVKNLAVSFCKVAEDGIDSKLMKKTKLLGKGKVIAVQKKASIKEKGDKVASSSLGKDKTDIAAEGNSQQSKKKTYTQFK
jgi:hypothetical protein